MADSFVDSVFCHNASRIPNLLGFATTIFQNCVIARTRMNTGSAGDHQNPSPALGITFPLRLQAIPLRVTAQLVAGEGIEPPTSGYEPNEIAFSLSCNKLFLPRGCGFFRPRLALNVVRNGNCLLDWFPSLHFSRDIAIKAILGSTFSQRHTIFSYHSFALFAREHSASLLPHRSRQRRCLCGVDIHL